jgi:hypothetical protein
MWVQVIPMKPKRLIAIHGLNGGSKGAESLTYLLSKEAIVKDDEIIKKILDHAKPDQMQAIEAMKKANETISMLSNELKTASVRWNEIFIVCATVLKHFGGKVVLGEDDMVALSPNDYTITIEPIEEKGERIVRLRHITEGPTVDNRADSKQDD